MQKMNLNYDSTILLQLFFSYFVIPAEAGIHINPNQTNRNNNFDSIIGFCFARLSKITQA